MRVRHTHLAHGSHQIDISGHLFLFFIFHLQKGSISRVGTTSQLAVLPVFTGHLLDTKGSTVRENTTVGFCHMSVEIQASTDCLTDVPGQVTSSASGNSSPVKWAC